jgi:CheY-like chemotaxis protein
MGQKEIGVHASILIVDDNAFIRRAIRLRFEGRNGFQVCGEAVDGSDAIEKARQTQARLDYPRFFDAGDEWAGSCHGAPPGNAHRAAYSLHDAHGFRHLIGSTVRWYQCRRS